MRKLGLLVLVLAGTATADSGPPFTLWMVEGASNQLYLLGSVHLLRKEDYPLPAVVDGAFDDSEHIVMELDMDDIDPLATQRIVNRLGLLPEGQTLADTLGERDYARAAAAAAALDIPLELLAGSEPWYAAITIEQLILSRLGFNPVYGVEMAIASKAAPEGKPITGLETIEEQLGFLDGLSAEAQRDLLLQTLDEGADIEGLMEQMITAWKRGDTAFLEANMLAELEDYPELYKTIVVDRNRRWLDQLEGLLDSDDDYLVVVGALHLIGDEGLPALLRARGIKVTQLNGSDSVPAD